MDCNIALLAIPKRAFLAWGMFHGSRSEPVYLPALSWQTSQAVPKKPLQSLMFNGADQALFCLELGGGVINPVLTMEAARPIIFGPPFFGLHVNLLVRQPNAHQITRQDLGSRPCYLNLGSGSPSRGLYSDVCKCVRVPFCFLEV